MTYIHSRKGRETERESCTSCFVQLSFIRLSFLYMSCFKSWLILYLQSLCFQESCDLSFIKIFFYYVCSSLCCLCLTLCTYIRTYVWVFPFHLLLTLLVLKHCWRCCKKGERSEEDNLWIEWMKLSFFSDSFFLAELEA